MPFALITLACNSSDDDEPTTTEETPVLVTKFTDEDFNMSFKYDGVKLLEDNTNDGRKTTYVYTGNLITQTKEYQNGTLTETADFTYDTNSKLALIKTVGTTIGSNTPNNYTYTFEYPNPSTVICTRVRNYTFAGNPQVSKDVLTYSFTNENIVLVKDAYYSNNVLTGNITRTYTYDDKKSPFVNILGFDKLLIYLSYTYSDELTGKNNLLSLSQTNVQVNSNTSSYKKNYSINYNDKNYPTQIVNKYYDGNNVLISSGVSTYSYNQ